MVAVALLLVALSYGHKLSCSTLGAGIGNTADRYDTHVYRLACYSDTLTLFNLRDLGSHVFPYVHGWYTAIPLPAVHGGTVEYPTLTGVWVWLSALPVSSAAGFLTVTALTFLPVVALTVLWLQQVAGRRAWIFAATPPLLLYGLYNWDLLPVAATAAGLAIALAGPRRWSPLTRAVIAAVAFGIGGAFKLYPVMFAAPLALTFLFDQSAPARSRVGNCLAVLGAAAATLLAANLPFMLINFDGWLSVFQFQAHRMIGASTLSVWYWGLLPWSASPTGTTQHLMGLLATGATALGLLLVLAAAAIIGKRRGSVPWIGAAAAMLCVYMVFNKVNSLQYVLWLLPFFAVLRIRLAWIIAYFVMDLAAFIGWYRVLFYTSLGNLEPTWANQALAIGVWGRAGLLLALIVTFLQATPTSPNTRDGRRSVHQAADMPSTSAVPPSIALSDGLGDSLVPTGRR
ncbi:hypothetical protein [Curtobacterium sp. Csp1]|uniref:hypothetical protein n=1 Tax=Curtobacterium sp. Csp1 TaxID=2495429 RepID=UPI0020C6AE79|nr:hypothetical protein [Curtobacterium sp. Csp1]